MTKYAHSEMTFAELNDLFCDGEDAYLDRKDSREAITCFGNVISTAINYPEDPKMRELALDAYYYIGTLHNDTDEYVWEEASELMERFGERIERLRNMK